MTAKTYAVVVGAVLVLVGIVGLIQGDGIFLGLLNIDLLEDLIHIASGGLLLAVGLQRNTPAASTVVGAVGVVYLVVGILGFIIPTLLGLIPTGYTIFDNILHLALGVLGLIAAGAGGAEAARRRA